MFHIAGIYVTEARRRAARQRERVTKNASQYRDRSVLREMQTIVAGERQRSAVNGKSRVDVCTHVARGVKGESERYHATATNTQECEFKKNDVGICYVRRCVSCHRAVRRHRSEATCNLLWSHLIINVAYMYIYIYVC